MSARAAWRLESLGFAEVSDYVAGKADWLASGLPTEGTYANVARIGRFARDDVPTCGLSDSVGEVWKRTADAGWDVCVVVNDERVVLGRLRERNAGSDPGASAESVMEDGPSTFRPDVALEEMANFMRKHKLTGSIVSRGDGTLIGLILRDDVERLMEIARARHEEHGHDEEGSESVEASEDRG
jgi:CBS domain-containing protein